MLPNHPRLPFSSFSSTETTTLLLDSASHCFPCTCTNYFLRLVICACTVQYVPTYLPTALVQVPVHCVPTVQHSTVHTYRLPIHHFFLLHKLRFWNSNDNTLKRKSPSYQMNIPNNIHMLHFPSRHQNRTTKIYTQVGLPVR